MKNNVAPRRADVKLGLKDLKHNQSFPSSSCSLVIAALCRELHPEAKTDTDAVLIHQKEIEKRVDFKTKYDLAASDDIEMFYVLHRVWNELKAQELMSDGQNGREDEII